MRITKAFPFDTIRTQAPAIPIICRFFLNFHFHKKGAQSKLKKGVNMFTGQLRFRLLFNLCKAGFVYSAQGAHPVVGNVFKGCSGIDAAVGISYFRVIFVTAYGTCIFCHDILL